jgi:hypothetical protein
MKSCTTKAPRKAYVSRKAGELLAKVANGQLPTPYKEEPMTIHADLGEMSSSVRWWLVVIGIFAAFYPSSPSSYVPPPQSGPQSMGCRLFNGMGWPLRQEM